MCGIALDGCTWQSDNGAEFVGSWQSKHDSTFTQAVQQVRGQVHRTIPPGQHRFQADAETVQSLMESEFYEIGTFLDRQDFLAKANASQLYFNLARRNSAKEDKTQGELLNQKLKNPHPLLPLLSVVYLDELHERQLHSSAAGGYDVRALPSEARTSHRARHSQ